MKKFTLLLVALVASCTLMAQEMSGIIAKGGKPKKGLEVMLSNSGQKTTTDKYGRFYFKNAEPGDVLQVNISSRKAARIPVSEARLLKIYIATGDFVLNNGVLEQRLPYTALTSKEVRGSVVSREQIEQSGLQRVSDILRHHMTGIEVSQAFMGSTIRVRGITSVSADNDPLFVIDGVDYVDVDIDALVPVETIEKIELHKDGSRWGVRGANGVIEITTTKEKAA